MRVPSFDGNSWTAREIRARGTYLLGCFLQGLLEGPVSVALPDSFQKMFATGVDIFAGWRFHAQLLRPMHGRVLELGRFRRQKRDLRQKLALGNLPDGATGGGI